MYYQQQQPPPYSTNPDIPPPQYTNPTSIEEVVPSYNYESDRTPLSTSPSQDKFQNSKYRDVFFVILFIVHMLALGAILSAGIVKYSKLPPPTTTNVSNNSTDYSNSTSTNNDVDNTFVLSPSEWNTLVIYLGICLGCAVTGLVLSFLYLALVKKFPAQMIVITLVLSITLWIGSGIALIISHQLIWGIIVVIFGLFYAFAAYTWRSRIAFASIMLRTVADVIEEYPATAYTAYVSVVIQVIFIFIWSIAVVLAQNFNQRVFSALFVFLLLSLYWTVQVIKNVVHVTVSGVFASWYFMKNTIGVPPNPTLGSLKRATTTSFGSICFGSLLVAALQTIRALISMARNGKYDILVAIADCILGIIDNLIQYFNKYAFTQVAIYGKTYLNAARDTWTLVKSHGIEAIINDNLISGVLTCGSLLGGLICAGLGAGLGYAYLRDFWISTCVAGFIIGISMVILTMEVVESGVATIFVAFAMDHEAMNRNHPQLYQKFRERYGGYPLLWT